MAPVLTVLRAFYHHVDPGDAQETPANGAASSACYSDALICGTVKACGLSDLLEYSSENGSISHLQRARDHRR